MNEYQIVSAESLKELQRKVNIEVESGWVPTGGVLSYRESGNQFHQALFLEYHGKVQ